MLAAEEERWSLGASFNDENFAGYWATFVLILMGLYPEVESFLMDPSKFGLLEVGDTIAYLLEVYFPEKYFVWPYNYLDLIWTGLSMDWWHPLATKILENDSESNEYEEVPVDYSVLLPDWARVAEVVGILATFYLAVELSDTYKRIDWIYFGFTLFFYFSQLWERGDNPD